MKNRIILALIISCFSSSLLTSCSDGNLKGLEQEIKTKVKSDIPHLAMLKANYTLNFFHYSENLIQSDDYYIRQDLAQVFYGYSLDDAKINVIREGDLNILDVELPLPKKISIDRRIVQKPLVTDEDYKPEDDDGKQIDIDAHMNKRLDETLKSYSEKTINKTQEVSQEYFEALASRYGLELRLTFLKGE